VRLFRPCYAPPPPGINNRRQTPEEATSNFGHRQDVQPEVDKLCKINMNEGILHIYYSLNNLLNLEIDIKCLLWWTLDNSKQDRPSHCCQRVVSGLSRQPFG
jgi:hypothetical protein